MANSTDLKLFPSPYCDAKCGMKGSVEKPQIVGLFMRLLYLQFDLTWLINKWEHCRSCAVFHWQ